MKKRTIERERVQTRKAVHSKQQGKNNWTTACRLKYPRKRDKYGNLISLMDAFSSYGIFLLSSSSSPVVDKTKKAVKLFTRLWMSWVRMFAHRLIAIKRQWSGLCRERRMLFMYLHYSFLFSYFDLSDCLHLSLPTPSDWCNPFAFVCVPSHAHWFSYIALDCFWAQQTPLGLAGVRVCVC